MNRTIFDKIGLPRPLAWAYLGILIFMMGDGIEQGWLSPYLIGRGLSLEQSAGLFTMYGVTIAISAWFSGVLAEAYGVKRTMFAGLVLYLLGTCGFVGLSLPGLHYPLMLVTYALRGFGYPLFAYSFLVWIAYAAPKDGLGKAVGWFWFVFTGGLNVLGAYYSSWAIERIGNINTLWTSVFWALLGAFFALVMNKSQKRLAVAGGTREKMKELLKGITIMKEEPKVLLGGIVRVINTTAQFAFPVFLPMYMPIMGSRRPSGSGSGARFSRPTSSSTSFSASSATKWGGATPLSGSAAWAAASPRCCSIIRRSFRRAISGW